MFVQKLQFRLRFVAHDGNLFGATPTAQSFVLRAGPTGRAAALPAWTTAATRRSELAPGTARAAPDWPGSSAGCFPVPVESFSQSVL